MTRSGRCQIPATEAALRHLWFRPRRRLRLRNDVAVAGKRSVPDTPSLRWKTNGRYLFAEGRSRPKGMNSGYLPVSARKIASALWHLLLPAAPSVVWIFSDSLSLGFWLEMLIECLPFFRWWGPPYCATKLFNLKSGLVLLEWDHRWIEHRWKNPDSLRPINISISEGVIKIQRLKITASPFNTSAPYIKPLEVRMTVISSGFDFIWKIWNRRICILDAPLHRLFFLGKD